MEIKVINLSKHSLPCHATSGSSGIDLRANISVDIEIKPMQRSLVKTGLYMSIPCGYEGQIRPRSGLALNHGITVLNSPGTIDSDYTGELKVLLINLSCDSFILRDGDRIAQLVISSYECIEVKTLEKTVRGHGGYGSTGIE